MSGIELFGVGKRDREHGEAHVGPAKRLGHVFRGTRVRVERVALALAQRREVEKPIGQTMVDGGQVRRCGGGGGAPI